MKELHGRASGTAPASKQRCQDLLLAAERYPEWHPEVIRSVTLAQQPARARGQRVNAVVHVSFGPVARDLELMLDVGLDLAGAVRLDRVPYDENDDERFTVHWALDEHADRAHTDIALEIAAQLDVPRFLPIPVHTIGDAFAGGFLAAAVAELGTER